MTTTRLWGAVSGPGWSWTLQGREAPNGLRTKGFLSDGRGFLLLGPGFPLATKSSAENLSISRHFVRRLLPSTYFRKRRKPMKNHAPPFNFS